MATAYVCSTCRTQLSRQKPRITGLLSRAVHTTQQQQQRRRRRPGVGSFFEGDVDNASTGQVGQQAANGGGEGVVRGRYSGKELKPAQLLAQLDNPFSSAEGHATPPPRPPPRHLQRPPPRHPPPPPPRHPPPPPPRHSPRPPQRHPVSAKNWSDINTTTRPAQPRPPGPRRPGRSRLPPPVLHRAQQFVALVQSQQWTAASTALHDLAHQFRTAAGWRVQHLFTVPDFEPSVRRLLGSATTQWLAGIASGVAKETQPSPFDVLIVMHTFGVSKPSLARPLLWQASSGLAELHSSMPHTADPDSPFVNGLRSLVKMWQIVMATYLKRGAPDAMSAVHSLGWSFLPPATVLNQQVPRTHEMFAQMLGMLVPMSQLSDLAHMNHGKALCCLDYASSALITLDLLRSATGSNSALITEAEISPFVHLLETLLKIAPAPRTPFSFQEQLSTLENPALLAYYKNMGNRLDLQDMQLPSPNQSTKAVVEDGTSPSMTDSLPGAEAFPAEDDLAMEFNSDIWPSKRFALVCEKRLGRALESKDMLFAEKIKREIYAFAGSLSPDTQALPLELYENLMLTFLSLKNPTAAIEIWNFIIQAGYKPTVKTYTTIMQGALTVRDVSGMQAFWQKMRQAGLQPDEFAWSVRISGLFKMKLPKEGFRAMSEMSREWLAAAKARALREASREERKQMAVQPNDLLAKFTGPVDGVPRPELVIVNSAISSIAQSHHGDISKVLTWGRAFGVEPDVITYNLLLNVAMRYQQTDEASKILRLMQQRGVAVDSATWTVLLNALLHGGFLEGLDHKQQQEKVLTFINSLEIDDTNISGINLKGYALLIDRLLKHYDNLEGAAAVMKHMLDRGHEPGTHIYTIFMTSYFQRQPQPDFAAIEALWKQIQSQHDGWGAKLDHVFYDRMMEGYAKHHRLAGIDKALGFLRRCRQAGQKPGWRALDAVARALADRQEWNRLRTVVDDVRTSLREGRGATQHMGQRNFWKFIVEDVGLLRSEGIEKWEDVLPNHYRQSPLLQAEASAQGQ